VEQVHAFFKKRRSFLAMVHHTMFPLNPQPPNLLALMKEFRNAAKVRFMVKEQLMCGAEVALMFAKACYPRLDLELIADGPPLGDNGAPLNLAPLVPLVKDTLCLLSGSWTRGPRQS
jgi:hypothetical protein